MCELCEKINKQKQKTKAKKEKMVAGSLNLFFFIGAFISAWIYFTLAVIRPNILTVGLATWSITLIMMFAHEYMKVFTKK